MNTDPIADLLTRLRNASRVNLHSCTMPYSKIKENILKIMLEKKFIKKFEITKDEKFPEILVTIEENRKLNLKRISKPGQRIYVKKENIKLLRSGLGTRVISTSKGVITDEEARKQNLGGEIICEIY
ncbi:MAG: 30S ribosomal protein S8 [Candidatus Gracilibacteria bacterium]